jgi:hypothetical protein
LKRRLGWLVVVLVGISLVFLLTLGRAIEEGDSDYDPFWAAYWEEDSDWVEIKVEIDGPDEVTAGEDATFTARCYFVDSEGNEEEQESEDFNHHFGRYELGSVEVCHTMHDVEGCTAVGVKKTRGKMLG